MQICASTYNFIGPGALRPCCAWHPSSQRFEPPGPICVYGFRAGPGLARHGEAWRGRARRGKATLSHSYRFSGRGEARRGLAWLGAAGHGLAWRGRARQGMVTLSHSYQFSGLGSARRGKARHG